MGPRLRMGIIGTAFAAVAVVAVVGWTRKPALEPVYNVGTGYAGNPYAGDMNAAALPANAPTAAPGTQAMYSDQQTAPYGETPAVNPCVQSVGYEYANPSYASRYGVRTVRPRVVVEERPRVYEERRVVRQERSTGKSVAIVAGSAGVGAAIGAIAGGGKGAAIGALAGGGGGFAYDRITHNR